MKLWQFASGLAVVILVCTGIGMTVSSNAKREAVRESMAELDRVSSELNPKLDELIGMLREPRVTKQHQEQHIHTDDAGAREDRRVRDILKSQGHIDGLPMADGADRSEER